MHWRITPAFDYGAVPPRLECRGDIPVALAGRDALAVCSWDAGDLQVDDESIFGRFEARESSSTVIALCGSHQEPLVFPARQDVEARLKGTIDYWRDWAAHRAYDGPWRAAVIRSAGTQAALPRTLRRNRCSGQRLPARGDRWRAQLGLPLLLGARLCVHSRCPAPARLSARGRGVLLVAAARIAVEPPAAASPLPPRRWRTDTRAHVEAGRLSARARSGSATPPPPRLSWTSTVVCSRPRWSMRRRAGGSTAKPVGDLPASPT